MKKLFVFVPFFALSYVMAAAAGAALWVNSGKPAFEEHTIVLPALPSRELMAIFTKSEPFNRPAAQLVGIGRHVPEEQQTIILGSLNWVMHGESKTSRIVISSPLAAAMRVAVRQENLSNAALRFLDGDRVQQEIQADDIVQKRIFWSPMVFADRVTLEIEMPADQEERGTLFISKVSHIPDEETLLAHGVGSSSECQVDLACNSDPALEKVANAVGKLFFTYEDGATETCTGTLLDNTGDEEIPYLFTASHCLSSQSLADTLNVAWFFRADTCSENAAPRQQLQTGGAELLALDSDYDWALLRLNEMPPTGVAYASWSDQPVRRNDAVVSLHHPKGDLLKRNDGKVHRFYDSLAIGSSYIEAILESGANEMGSSGAPLLTRTDGGDYLVRGARMFGYSNCATSGVPDYYIRLDRMIPYVREYLTPQIPYSKDHVMVLEYFHRGFDRYFMTASPSEIHALDTYEHLGWVRTGLRFFAYDKPTGGAQPVCRYYMKPELGDAHFYSASMREYLTSQIFYSEGHAAVSEYFRRGSDRYSMTTDPSESRVFDAHEYGEWARTALRFLTDGKPVGAQSLYRDYVKPELNSVHFYSASAQGCRAVGERFSQSWVFESADVFYIGLPNTATGQCPKNTQPVWGFLHQPETGYRYTANITIRDDLRITEGWTPEGYGEDAVVMCAPLPAF